MSSPHPLKLSRNAFATTAALLGVSFFARFAGRLSKRSCFSIKVGASAALRVLRSFAAAALAAEAAALFALAVSRGVFGPIGACQRTPVQV